MIALALFVAASGAATASDPQIEFRECMAKQARAMKGTDRPSYAVAKRFAANCSSKLKGLSVAEQRRVTRNYTCAFSGFEPPCPRITD